VCHITRDLTSTDDHCVFQSSVHTETNDDQGNTDWRWDWTQSINVRSTAGRHAHLSLTAALALRGAPGPTY
jgi:hypothetical protein